MTEQLKGKIYWVLDDFSYIGQVVSKKDTTSHAVARIDNVIIEEYMIKFYVLPFEINGETWSYNVNLLMNDTGTKYTGQFTEDSEPDHSGEVNCELYRNPKHYMLYGHWTEDEWVYTWWAIISREETKNI
jgi:hypothetical protein